jgi:hypothetical protein
VRGRAIVVGVLALLLVVTIVRNAAVDALSDLKPARAATFWRSHPAVEIGLGITEIAEAARMRRAVSPDAFTLMDEAARKAPLAPEPFLVRGVQAQLAGDMHAAERAFAAAESRDPRSLPAHYFLAEHYFRERDAARGLREVVSLASLSPNGAGGSAPYLAAFARDPANWAQMRTIFRAYPWIEHATLNALSQDPGSARTILAIAQPDQLTPSSEWLPSLLSSLIKAGDYGQAKAIWASVSRVAPGNQALLFDEGFTNSVPPPPFNWALTSSSLGLAERQAGGRLHAIYYGQDDGILARQLVVLPAGRYRLSMKVLPGASQPQSLAWAVTCVGGQAPLARVPLNVAATNGVAFEVPANCPAQYIDLVGTSADLPQQSDVTITDLKLTAGANG